MDTADLLARWAERLQREEPGAVAVLCHGSYARGEPEAHSDLDMDVLVDREPGTPYRSAFEALADGRLLHVTIKTMALEEWLGQFDAPAESEPWAFFLPARQDARLLWATPEARDRLEGRISLDFAAAPQLQDFLESACKVRNAAARGDELGVRLAAQDLGLCCPGLLALLAPPPPAASRRAALQAALEMSTAPSGYREDLLVCLGLSGRAVTVGELHDTALRLAGGVIGALRPLVGELAGRVEPGLPEALADGRLSRLLTQPGAGGSSSPAPALNQQDQPDV